MSTLKNVNVKFDMRATRTGVRTATKALSKFSKALMKRPRRSRQCRGSRARNYRRTLARCSEGAKRNNDTSRVLAEGQATGAVAAHRRVMAAR